MSRLTLRLPESLHQQLSYQASQEGVSLNQYIVYALTRQVSQNYVVEPVSAQTVEQQSISFQKLLNDLGQATPEEVKLSLDTREVVEPENELSADIISKLRQKIASKA
ncbi:type II toxin-antitoxin system HicB family antitoxin [Anabaenopsis tanganyikae CS-531]|uniref:Toxin-antitoxin system HicB family antitoxin n=2 Tax=Anabaenopsis TaxID=110103 RepID=A0ABT5AP61_9CYAN|nr:MULTISPECIES: YlcI/YnfO family protein [Nostocales]MDB9445006.1 toxin-antitoxin system HicB family antitoxin [Anabaena sp. CS-542/02]MDB9539116.1 toxin-antitoxin system HicB family antitoxin [Anabaenopsis arnoldii]MDH6091404.1 type II toxin-antitoxin system HicB family antitoxin [Anabaenopsis arnoldii]MDH6105684.1 type II toxin-antitoxin system HicB family antitoxin [Anabaenopsis tanganyikae CS-531]